MRKLPFKFNPTAAGKQARLRRLKRNGLTPSTDKASQRQAADLAAATHNISRS